jgi:hypothetical protein
LGFLKTHQHRTETAASPDAAMEHQKRAVGLGVPPKNSILPSVKKTYRIIDGIGRRNPLQKKIYCNVVRSSLI